MTATTTRTTPAVSPRQEVSTRGRAERILPVVFVAVLVVLSFGVHVHALRRDLPLQDTDEDFFVGPAVSIAATGNANPHWFGHPGSTVIYPVAGLIHVWDAVAHGGPIVGGHAALARRFADTPETFYVIGRLWTILLSVACIPLVFLLSRRLFGARVAYVATALWVVVPIAVHFGRTVRTDSAATLFTLLALYLAVRAWDDPRRRMVVFAGAAVGLAIASRYFMVVLLPVVATAAVAPYWNERRRALERAALTVGSTVGAFILSTPYFLLDFSQARHDINQEANVPHAVASGLSPPGNLHWYLTNAVPGALTWPLYLAAVVGAVLVVVDGVRGRQRLARLLLPAFCALFLLGISASKWHWQRWAIQILPILVILAAVTVDALVKLLRGRGAVALTVVLTALLAIVPLKDLRDVDQYDRAPSTYKLALDWVGHNAPKGSTVEFSASLFATRLRAMPPAPRGISTDFRLNPTKPLDSYRRRGVSLVAVSEGEEFGAALKHAQQPAQAAFFRDLACGTRLVARFPLENDRFGYGVSVYALGERPVKLLNLLCGQPQPAAGERAR